MFVQIVQTSLYTITIKTPERKKTEKDMRKTEKRKTEKKKTALRDRHRQKGFVTSRLLSHLKIRNPWRHKRKYSFIFSKIRISLISILVKKSLHINIKK